MSGEVGKARPHESAVGHVTGAARYVDDLWPVTGRVAHAWPVVSPHAHARVVDIDVIAAKRDPAVLAVLTAADVPGVNDVGAARRDEPLFPSEVSHLGQAVAWVIAETEDAAKTGASRVSVRYEPLPAILSIEQAIEAGAYLTEPARMRRGDPKQALRTSPHRLEGELFIGGQEHFYLETQAALAFRDEDGGYFVHSSTQHPSETQEICARVLGVQKHSVTVQCVRMGGAFGGKEVQANGWAAVAVIAAAKLGRPVRVRLNRRQDMTMTGKRHPFLARFAAGYDGTGKLLALEAALYSDGGWCLDLSAPVLERALFHSDNCYFVPDVEVVGTVCRTHHQSHTAFRGFGGPQGMLVIEEVMDRVARSLGLPPHVVRQRNFYREGNETHYGQVVRDAARIDRLWKELAESSELTLRWEAVRAFNATSPHVKRGLAATPVKFGISFTTAFFNQAGALVLIYKDGSVQVNHGGTEMGQGLHTKMLQIAADALGLPAEAVRIMPTRTDKVPNTSATAASAGSDLNGAAVRAACSTLRERLAEVAAVHFRTTPDAITFADGRVYPTGDPSSSITFEAIVSEAYLARVSLSSTGYYRTPELHFDRASGKGKPFHYFSYGASVSEVEVDGFTGQYRLLRTDILHDVGDSLSPLVDRGQVEGGFVQGVGWLTTEELVWNAQGALATAGASTYKLPTAFECPADLRVRFLARAAEPGVVHGSKAVGEPPLMLAISVREALRDAVASFGDDGITELACPATPEAVFWSIERVRERSVVKQAASWGE
ncbi:MAG TPA: xanthine dehydrogenase molybdopterin binding subunit [Polyangiaceae bacterium]|jgi:xanthine dehydrogenase large subunit|nr:xanthine dehydrogenase molybdopterin binding subunit [Polyangiaceae bacterium]